MTSHPTSLPCRTSPRYRRALVRVEAPPSVRATRMDRLVVRRGFREHVPRKISGEGALAYSHSPKAAGRLTARSRHDGFAPATFKGFVSRGSGRNIARWQRTGVMVALPAGTASR